MLLRNPWPSSEAMWVMIDNRTRALNTSVKQWCMGYKISILTTLVKEQNFKRVKFKI